MLRCYRGCGLQRAVALHDVALMRPCSVDVCALGAVLLVSGCFNPEPPDEVEADDAMTDGGSTSDDADPPDGPEPEPDPGSTSDAPGGESSGDAESQCGDGILQGGEECDLGGENADDGACTQACTVAVCGDGFVHLGAEVCDDGEASALCDADCTQPECGDGIVNPLAFEQCDGNEVTNGTCQACTAVCDPGWSRCGGGPAAPCDSVIDSQASCIACGHEWRDEILHAAEHVTVDSEYGPMPMVAFIESAHYDTYTVTGWMGFDLDDIPTPIYLTQARLELHVMMTDGAAIADVVVDDTHGWNPAELAAGPVVYTDFAPFDFGLNPVDLNLDTWNWAESLGGGWLSVGLVPRGAVNSRIEVEGTHSIDLGPRLRVQGCF